MHYCSYIAATEGRADFSPFFPSPHPCHIYWIYTLNPLKVQVLLPASNLRIYKSPSRRFGLFLFTQPWVSLANQRFVCKACWIKQPANHIIQFAMLGGRNPENWKNLLLQETEIKEREKNKEAQLSLKRHSVSKGTQSPEKEKTKQSILSVKKFPWAGSWLLVAVGCTQIPPLECQHHCVQSMAETGECCFLKVIAHYHRWLQQ